MRITHDAELPAGIGALQGQRQFLRRPNHLAHVDGREPPPQPQHVQPFAWCARMAAASAAMAVRISSLVAVTYDRRRVRVSGWSA